MSANRNHLRVVKSSEMRPVASRRKRNSGISGQSPPPLVGRQSLWREVSNWIFAHGRVGFGGSA